MDKDPSFNISVLPGMREGKQANEEKDRVFQYNGNGGRISPERGDSMHCEELPGYLASSLQNSHLLLQEKHNADVSSHLSGHGHGDAPPSIVTAVASAAINFMLMFGLCCAYGMIMFADDFHSQHTALGVKMNLATAMIIGLLLATVSGVPVAIGGPDLNPVVFIGGFVTTIGKNIAEELELEMESSYRRLNGVSAVTDAGGGFWARLLGGGDGSGSDFCAEGGAVCEDYHAQLRATTIFAVAVSSFIFGIVFVVFGTMKWTRMVNYIPASIMEAFLSCIGYKVFKYALKFSKFKVTQFVPAACVGVVLYFMKAKHIGNPAIVMPLGLLAPLALFYFVCYLSNSDDPIGQARDDGYMFPKMEDEGNEFWRIWTDGFGNPNKINFKAYTKTLPELCIMVTVCVMDCVLKISGTETKLPVKVHRDYEVLLYGIGNFLTPFFGASVGYMQLKFNVINYGVVRNLTERRAGALYAVMCGFFFFWRVMLFNYLPRFFLSTLLFFAGAGFVAENLWGSRKYLSFKEWLEVLLIIAVFIVTESLLYAVVAGGALCGLTFIFRYARIPAIAGAPATGMTIMTSDRRGLEVTRSLQHIGASWLLVLRLKGYMFFASANSVTQYVKNRMEQEETMDVPRYRRLHFVILDLELLDHMDVSSAKAMKKFVQDSQANGVRILWSHVSPQFSEELRMREIPSTIKDCFEHLDDALRHVEDEILHYRKKLQDKWIALHHTFANEFEFKKARVAFEPFEHIFMVDRLCVGCPWLYCTKMRIKQFKTLLLRGGESKDVLFLVHSGKVGMFDKVPIQDSGQEWNTPLAVYRHGWFVNREAMAGAASQHFAIALEDGEVLCWTTAQWRKMSRECPNMVHELMKALLKQQVRDSQESAHTAGNLQYDMDETEWVDFQDLVDPDGAPTSISFKPHTGIDLLGKLRNNIGLLAPGSPKADEDSCSGTVAPGGGFLGSWVLPKASIPVCQKNLSTALKDGAPKKHMPEVLRYQLQQFQAAQALGRLGFFDHLKDNQRSSVATIAESVVSATPEEEEKKDKGEVLHPKLPEGMQRLLEIAFSAFGTFCSKDGKEEVIPPSRLTDAMMYAGIFHCKPPSDTPALNKRAFLEMGHDMLMAPLYPNQVEQIKEIFNKYDWDDSDYLEVDELSVALKGTLHPSISSDEVEIIAHVWSNQTNAGHVDIEVFTGIFSHYIRKHEHNWRLLEGLREIMGVSNDGSTVNKKLTVGKLTQVKNFPLTVEEAEEMLWSADWRNCGNGNGRELDLSSVLSAILLFLEQPEGRLPPPPRLRTSQVRKVGANKQDIRNLPKLGSVEKLEDNDAVDTGDNGHFSDLVTYLMEHSQMEKPRKDYLFTFGDNITSSVALSNSPHTPGGSPTKSDDGKAWGEEPTVRPNSWRAKVHILLEEPGSSRFANCLSIFIGILILLSVVSLILEPTISGAEEDRSDAETLGWLISECFFSAVFTIEYLLRLIVADALGTQTIWQFLKDPSNICDLFAILPLYIEMLLSNHLKSLRLLLVVRLARLTRLARFGRLARLSKRSTLAAPVSMVLIVIWGIYLKELEGGVF